MAMQEEVSLANVAPVSEVEDPSEVMMQATQEVKRCLHVANDSLPDICRAMEEATSEVMIRPIFRRFNSVTQIFLRLIPEEKHGPLIAKALNELGASTLLLTFLDKPGSIEAAIRDYKSAVLRNLAALMLRNKESHRADDEKDDALFSELLPVPSPEPEVLETSKNVWSPTGSSVGSTTPGPRRWSRRPGPQEERVGHQTEAEGGSARSEGTAEFGWHFD